MRPRSTLLSGFALVGFALGGAVSGRGQLVAASPFQAPPGSGANQPTPGAPLEYRGYIETPEGTQYRVYDPARKAGAWVKLNQKNLDLDVVAKKFDDDRNTLTIEHQGKTLTLAERESRVVSSGAAVQAMPQPVAPAPPPMPAAVTQSVVVNPTPADEQRRLEAVAAEVARRRALREQATQQINPGGAPPKVMPQPPVQLPRMQQQGQPGR